MRERRESRREREVGGFGQFNDTWSQYGHSVSCMTILLKTVWCREGGRERGRRADLGQDIWCHV